MPKRKPPVQQAAKTLKPLLPRQEKRTVKVKTRPSVDERLVRFVDVYRRTFSATEAAKAIGYADSSAGNAGHALLQRPVVQEMLAKASLEAMAETKISAGEILSLIREIAVFDPAECYRGRYVNGQMQSTLKEVLEMPAHVRRCISSMKVLKQNIRTGDGVVDEVIELKFWSKTAALELLASHAGLLKMQLEIDHRIRVETVEKLTDEELLAEGEQILERLRRDAVARATSRVPVSQLEAQD